jgi:hypothetical protein
LIRLALGAEPRTLGLQFNAEQPIPASASGALGHS